MGRMDAILADTRKYGFTLVTVLLTANALVTTANPVVDRVAGSAIVMVLVLVLFLIDRYWWVLLREAAERARALEPGLGIAITTLLGEAAERSLNTLMASAVYTVFIAVAFVVALVAVLPNGPTSGLYFLIMVTTISIASVWALHFWFEKQLKDIKSRKGTPRTIR
jgi:hypothetical protein